MKKLPFVCFFLVFFLNFSQVSAFAEADFAYFKNITGEAEQGLVSIELDQEIYQHSNYADLTILNEQGEIQPMKLVNTDFALLSPTTEVLEATPAIDDFENQTFVVQNLFDGNLETYYEATADDWDPVAEGYQAYLILDFGAEKEIEVVDFTLTKFAKYWEQIAVESSSDNLNFTQVVSAKDEAKQLYFENLKTRYLKITFWYPELLSIAEISVYGKEKAKLLFDYDPTKAYRLFYGNMQKTARENANFIYTKDLPVLTLGEEEDNPNYNADYDADGILNAEDNCPLEANPEQTDTDKDGIGDVCDSTKFMDNQDSVDLDFDGIGQASDNCVFIKNAHQSDKNQNGIGDECDDDDADSILNVLDNCPNVKNYAQADRDHDGIGDVCAVDSDADDIPQNVDNCPNVANPDQLDSDGDTIGDVCDNCPNVANFAQRDENENGIGDVCEDSDQDGIFNAEDNCPNVSNPDQLDSDGDTIGDVCDNCREIKNISQWDDDGDGVGNECDDDDGDGVIGKNDNCPNHANPDQLDSDQNGVGDVCEDYDGDGIIDLADNCVKVVNPEQTDLDQDGIGDVCDSKVVVAKPPYLFYGLSGVILLAILYYVFKLIKQIFELKDEKEGES